MASRAVVSWGQRLLGGGRVETPAQRLGRLPAGRRRFLARITGAPHADAASLVDHLSRPEVVATLAERLDGPALRAARLFVEAAEPVSRAVFEAEVARRFGEGDEAGALLGALEASGLLFRQTWTGGAEVLGLVPPLAQALRPYLWLLGDTRAPEALPLEAGAERASPGLTSLRELARVLAAVLAGPPRLLPDGRVHGGDLERLREERLPLAGRTETVAAHVERLFELGLVVGAGARARCRYDRAVAFFDLAPAARLPLLLASDPEADGRRPRPPGRLSPRDARALVVAALMELPAGTWAHRAALAAAVRARVLASDTLSPYADAQAASEEAERSVRRALGALAPALERSGPEGEWLRLPTAEPGEAEAGWVVQPTLEIVVPPEVLCGEVVRLAAVADLKRADVVDTFLLGPDSVARAVALGLDGAAILGILSRSAAVPLPESLPAQVEGWVRSAEAAGPGPEAAAVPMHRQPRAPRLPRGPRRRWSGPVARFRCEALARLGAA